jgi:ankyrin repeat protein
MYATSNGHSDVIKYLLTYKGILINAKDKEGKTPLMYAVMGGRKDVVQLLIESKVNVNARTNTDESALSFALKTGRAEIIALLKSSGARE